MKKRIIILVAFALFAAGSAYAATNIVGGTSVSIGTGNFTPSTKVRISVSSNGSSYGAASIHESGTVAYATGGGTGFGSDTTKIFTATCSANPCGTTPPTATATALATGAITGTFQ
jgi:hypothetical protein